MSISIYTLDGLHVVAMVRLTQAHVVTTGYHHSNLEGILVMCLEIGIRINVAVS